MGEEEEDKPGACQRAILAGSLACSAAVCLHLHSGQQLCPNLIIIPSYSRHML